MDPELPPIDSPKHESVHILTKEDILQYFGFLKSYTFYEFMFVIYL